MLLCAAQAAAWGPQGHRVAGAMTWQYLSADTREQVRQLIGDESLAEASTWADRMRDNPSPFWQRQAGPYHYVTVPPGKSYTAVGAPAKGDGVTALAGFSRVLRDPQAPRVQKQLALRFSLHIIQDLHQPMHVGNGRDRGGNSVRLRLDGESTNLHRVWDSAILNAGGMSDAAWLSRYGSPEPAQVAQWRSPRPEDWIAESAALRDRVYPAGKTIDTGYLDTWLPSVHRRLQQSAVRCAAWLDQVLGASDAVETSQ